MLPRTPVTVPRLAVALAWEWERIGPAHPVLGVVDLWMADGAAEELSVLARRALAEPELYDLHRNRVAGEFHDVLLTIAHARQECYGFSTDQDGAEQSVLAVPHGRNTLVVTVRDGLIVFHRVPGRRLSRAVVQTLPACPPARVGPLVVAEDRYELDGDAEQLRNLMTASRTAAHQLHVAVRVDGERRASVPLTVVDTEDSGRVLTYLRTGAELVCLPGSPERITAALEDTLAGLDP